MIILDVADLVVVAGRVLGIGTDAALAQLDVAAAESALAEARPVALHLSGDPAAGHADREATARAGIALVHALLRHHPFPGNGQQVAVAAGLQFLSLNGWRADLDPPAAAAVVVEALASGQLSADAATAWLSPRLSPRVPRHVPRRSQPSPRRVLVSVMLTIALGGLAMLATACSRSMPPSAARQARPAATARHSPVPTSASATDLVYRAPGSWTWAAPMPDR